MLSLVNGFSVRGSDISSYAINWISESGHIPLGSNRSHDKSILSESVPLLELALFQAISSQPSTGSIDFELFWPKVDD